MKIVTAKTRKRCPHCRQIISVGEQAVLTDDRYASEAYMHHTGGYMKVQRGAWHLWHPTCREEQAQAAVCL